MFNLFGKKAPAAGPDFSGIDSVGKAEVMAARGELEPLLLLPEAFGGEANPMNLVYVPVGIAGVKASTDENVIMPLVAQGTVSRYAASPRYQGASVIPIAIDITASDPGRFSTTVRVWGDGLKEA